MEENSQGGAPGGGKQAETKVSWWGCLVLLVLFVVFVVIAGSGSDATLKAAGGAAMSTFVAGLFLLVGNLYKTIKRK